jgi:group I intron endonuclease
VYIGQSKSCTTRWRGHKSELKGGYHGNSYLQASYNKYGLEAFEYSILEACIEDQRDQRELYWIGFYNATDRSCGYNRLFGGCQNKNHSQETKDKIREVLKQKNITPPSRKGVKWSEEHKAHMSEMMTGRKLPPCSEEKKEKLRLANLGKKASEETRKKLSEAKIGNKNMVGFHVSDETKQKISLAQKGVPKRQK